MEVDDRAGERIRELRLERGLSQSAACGPGVSKSYLSLIESGRRRPTPAVLRTLADTLGTTVEYLAHGRRQPGDVESTVLFAELAAVNGAPRTALEQFTAALAALPAGTDSAHTAELRRRAAHGRARALEQTGRLDLAAAEYDALWRSAEPGSVQWATYGIDLCRTHRTAGDLDYAAEVGERALEAFERLGLEWSDETVRLGVTLGGVYGARGDLLRGEMLLRRMIDAAERVGTPLARGSAYWNAATSAYDTGRLGDALTLAEKALALFGETDHRRNLTMLRHAYGVILAVQPGRLEEGRRELAAAYAASREVGGVGDLAACLDSLAETALAADDLSAAAEHLAAADDLPLAELSADLRALLRVRAADLAFRTGAPERARHLLRTAQQTLTAEECRSVEAWQRIAELWHREDEPLLAAEAYRTALAATGLAAAPRPAPAPRPATDRAP
ncbi:hypothetical protein Kpho02_00640 [Kitasatospora phosalacinea]|uniref:HTH cro/C1-type domain-containing protein n=1 Tax=Kitasatospora phosalacinea TaxID=2065 RepID=A0A9W6Q0L3_9ACTN|nr:helix-turn-helix transcriptional regulator [Kitasatospora phosalacinea]GLW67765.1 hypothetical protein Kpho02_00640 [Kitasatospora phosalacinea]